jgi:hypothetical protein
MHLGAAMNVGPSPQEIEEIIKKTFTIKASFRRLKIGARTIEVVS